LGALTLDLGVAGQPSSQPPDRAPSENRAKTTGDRSPRARHGDEGPASTKSSQSGGTKTTAKPHSGPKLPQPFQGTGGHQGEKRTNNAQLKGASANAAELHQPGLNKFAGGVKGGSMINEMEKQHHLAVAGLSGTPPLNQVLHPRGPGPAFIGGPAMLSARNTAVINGTAMRHRP
jgi:hypothetical protein